MKTSQAASPSVTSTDIWISLTVFVLLYAALGVADAYLMIHYGRKSLEPDPDEETGPDRGSDRPDDAEPARLPALIY